MKRNKFKKEQYMNQITAIEAISTIISYFGTKLAKEKSVKDFFSEFTEATVNWIKPLFLNDDGTEKEAIEKLKEKPNSSARKNAVRSILEMELEDNSKAEKLIMEMFEQIAKKEGRAEIMIENMNAKKNIDIINKQKGEGYAIFKDFSAGGEIKIDNQQED